MKWHYRLMKLAVANEGIEYRIDMTPWFLPGGWWLYRGVAEGGTYQSRREAEMMIEELQTRDAGQWLEVAA